MTEKSKEKEADVVLVLGTEGFIGLKELRHFVPFHRAHVAKLVRRGEFPRPVKLGRRTVFRRAEIRDWLSQFD